jgi:Lon protease (S16) C-terminal proteolytic domain
MGLDGVEKFVATPELQSEDSIGYDPLPEGQVWAISPGGQDEAIGLFRIEANEGPGNGVRILNQSPPAPFRESVKLAEQNLYARARELVGDRNPREHEFAVQLRSFDAARSGDQVGVAVLIALCSALLGKPLRGGLAIVGGLNLGGSIDPVHNPIDVVELVHRSRQKIHPWLATHATPARFQPYQSAERVNLPNASVHQCTDACSVYNTRITSAGSSPMVRSSSRADTSGKQRPKRAPATTLTIERDVALEHRQQPLAVSRVARVDHQIEGQPAPTGGQIELVTVVS